MEYFITNSLILSFSAKRSCNAAPKAFGARPGFQSRINLEQSSQGKWTKMFESLASCFAFRCSASLNMTEPFVRPVVAA
jgi:hypothetical protein